VKVLPYTSFSFDASYAKVRIYIQKSTSEINRIDFRNNVSAERKTITYPKFYLPIPPTQDRPRFASESATRT